MVDNDELLILTVKVIVNAFVVNLAWILIYLFVSFNLILTIIAIIGGVFTTTAIFLHYIMDWAERKFERKSARFLGKGDSYLSQRMQTG